LTHTVHTAKFIRYVAICHVRSAPFLLGVKTCIVCYSNVHKSGGYVLYIGHCFVKIFRLHCGKAISRVKFAYWTPIADSGQLMSS